MISLGLIASTFVIPGGQVYLVAPEVHRRAWRLSREVPGMPREKLLRRGARPRAKDRRKSRSSSESGMEIADMRGI